MENNEFKNIWKTAVDKEIRKYSETELNAMVVKNARKSMRKLIPQWFVVFSIFVVGYMFWKIYTTSDLRLISLYTFVSLVIVVSLIIYFFSMRKMNKYKLDMSVKEWLKFRINEIDKGIQFPKKYKIHIDVGLSIMCIGIVGTYFYIVTGSLISYRFALAILFVFPYMVIFIILFKNRYSKVRDYLQSLYEQIEGE